MGEVDNQSGRELDLSSHAGADEHSAISQHFFVLSFSHSPNFPVFLLSSSHPAPSKLGGLAQLPKMEEIKRRASGNSSDLFWAQVKVWVE